MSSTNILRDFKHHGCQKLMWGLNSTLIIHFASRIALSGRRESYSESPEGREAVQNVKTEKQTVYFLQRVLNHFDPCCWFSIYVVLY